MKQIIENLKIQLDCKTPDDLAAILGVSRNTIFRAQKNEAGKQFRHICRVLGMILSLMPKRKLELCQIFLRKAYIKEKIKSSDTSARRTSTTSSS